MVVAERETRPIAAALFVKDATRLYGRYWGAIEHVPLLHFECCYYQAIEYAIARGLQVFEGGAQGEHKIFRGLLPVEALGALAGASQVRARRRELPRARRRGHHPLRGRAVRP
jgi:predicted N-acyltransferase